MITQMAALKPTASNKLDTETVYHVDAQVREE